MNARKGKKIVIYEPVTGNKIRYQKFLTHENLMVKVEVQNCVMQSFFIIIP